MYSLPKWSKHLKQLLLKGLKTQFADEAENHELNKANVLLVSLQGLFKKEKACSL